MPSPTGRVLAPAKSSECRTKPRCGSTGPPVNNRTWPPSGRSGATSASTSRASSSSAIGPEPSTRLTISPMAPSASWLTMTITVSANRGSGISGAATRSWPERKRGSAPDCGADSGDDSAIVLPAASTTPSATRANSRTMRGADAGGAVVAMAHASAARRASAKPEWGAAAAAGRSAGPSVSVTSAGSSLSVTSAGSSVAPTEATV